MVGTGHFHVGHMKEKGRQDGEQSTREKTYICVRRTTVSHRSIRRVQSFRIGYVR